MDLPTQCPLCQSKGFSVASGGSSREYECKCDTCGEFATTHEFMLYRHNRNYEDKWHKISGLVREKNEAGEKVLIVYKELENLFKDSLIPNDDDIEKKAAKLLKYLKNKSVSYGTTIHLHLEKDKSVAYSKDQNEFIALIKLLEQSGYIDAKILSSEQNTGIYYYPDVETLVTARGWELAKGLSRERSESNQGFIAIRFEDKDSDPEPCIAAIEKAIEAAGFTPMCIRQKHYPERVMDKALAEIRKSKFVVVDLTKNRCAVSFEAGFALAMGIECIFVCQKGEKVEDFYAKSYNYLTYENAEDLKQKVEDAIKARITH
jgi:hypothetical protein